MAGLRGKSLVAVARDVSEGYVIVNPLFLKPLDEESVKGLYHQIMRIQGEIRREKFPSNDIGAIRRRNMRLQRLHTAHMIIRNFAKAKKFGGFFP